jgi:hypothetical protein
MLGSRTMPATLGYGQQLRNARYLTDNAAAAAAVGHILNYKPEKKVLL